MCNNKKQSRYAKKQRMKNVCQSCSVMIGKIFWSDVCGILSPSVKRNSSRSLETSAVLLLMLFIECENAIQQNCSSASSILCGSSHCLLFVLASSSRCHFRETLSRRAPRPAPSPFIQTEGCLVFISIKKSKSDRSTVRVEVGRARLQSGIQTVLYLGVLACSERFIVKCVWQKYKRLWHRTEPAGLLAFKKAITIQTKQRFKWAVNVIDVLLLTANVAHSHNKYVTCAARLSRHSSY